MLIDGAIHPPAPHLGAQLANDPHVTAEDMTQLLAVNCSDLSTESLEFFKQFTTRYVKSMARGTNNVELASQELEKGKVN
jgi:hypothetical protein